MTPIAYELVLICARNWVYVTNAHAECYILVERSAQCELDGYDFVTLHVVIEAYASDTLVRAAGLWAYGWYRVARAWEISQVYKVFRGDLKVL